MDEERRTLAEQIWEAIDAGDPFRGLEIAAQAGNDAPDDEAALATAAAHMEVEDFAVAKSMLEALANRELDGDLEYARLWHLAQCEYHAGNAERALEIFYTLEPADSVEHANVLWWRGLCYDHTGKPRRADECFREAARIDPMGAPQPLSISADEMEKIVKLCAAQLPQPLRDALAEISVVIEDLPSRDLVQKSGGEVLPDTLGLYTGVHLLDRSVLDPPSMPPQIHLFRRNLERIARTREELVGEIRTTLFHELGHHLGYDEEGLDRLGLA
ncbi:MAG: metallopeptidase family protein [Planctomycetes bacterium]|nr:metallopeptidase family protein [Planctomycetota bacterium]